MAKTYNQIKKSVLGKNYDINRNNDKQQKTYADIKTGVKDGKYNFNLIKSELEKKIKLDTFESDLSSVGKTILDNANNWQTQETMLNTRASIESMKDRIGSYKEYMRLFGNKETADIKGIEKIHNSYRDVLDEWDAISELYGQYKNSDAFNVGKKLLLLDNEYTGLTFDEVQAKKKEFAEDSFEYKYFDNYTKYTDLNEFDKAINNLKIKKSGSNVKNYDGVKIDNSNKTLQIKSLGTDLTKGLRNPQVDEALKKSAEEALRKSTEEATNSPNKESYYEKIAFEGRDLEIERNKWKLDHAFDLYKDVMQNEDFAETSKYVSTKGNYDNLWDKLNNGQYGLGYGDLTYEYINNVDGIRDEIDSKANTYSKDSPDSFDSGNSSMKDKGYDKLNAEEVSVYNSLYKYDKENGTNKAQKFLDDMEKNLTKREYDERTKLWKSRSETPGGAILGSILSVPASVFGSIPTLVDGAKDFLQGKEYNPYSANKTLTNFAQDTRKYVGENIEEATEGMEVFGQNIPSFLYSTGMSMADSFLGATTLGSAYLPLAGTSAFHQKAKELTEAGEDSATIYKTALASGAAEIIFEKFSLDHFLKIKNVDDIGRIVKNTLVQAGIEGSEELATEISNIITDSAIRGESSELSQYRLQLLKSGLTEKEADIEVAKRIGSQVTWSGIGGALSGAGMGFAGGVGNYIENASTGSVVKGNERVQDLFDIANNPEIASAYETYTRYANKGINTDNVSNAQLGRLYNEVKTDAVEKFNSKKSTAEQRQRGLETLAKLSIVETENEIRKEAKEKHNIGEETKVTESGESFNVNDMKIQGDKVTVATEKGEISVDDTTLAQKDAEIVTLAQRISESDGEDVANLFLSQYDGQSNPLEYANSFNLTMEYSKKNFSYDTILQRKGVLSAGQVAELYKITRIKADKEKAERIRKLNEEMAGKKFYKGFIDESVIDYDNTSAEGKINWNSLSSTERQAITFIKGVAQATGMNLILEHNPKSNYNGRFSVQGNTITLDVKAGIGQAEKFVSTLIPTMSHEVTHWMKEKSPELWTSLNNIVFSTLVEHYNLDAEQSIKDKIKLLDRLDPRIKHSEEDAKGRTITEEDLIQAEYQRLVARDKKVGRKINEDALMDEAREEIIARACEDMLSMSKQGRKIFNSLSESEQKTLYEKIKGLINDLLTWVDELLKSYNSQSTEARIMRMYQEKLNEASKVWDEMLEQSVKANQSLEKSGAYNHRSVGEGKIRFNEKESLNDACDSMETISDEEYIRMKNENPFVSVMDFTPQIILDSVKGSKVLSSFIKNRKILIKRDALYLAIRENGVQEGHYHGLGADTLKKLPEYLEKPDAIITTNTSNKRCLVLSHINAKNGQGIISVEFESLKDYEGNYDYYNVVITVFDLHENYIKKLFNKNDAEINYEKEDLEQVNPQLYKWLRIFNSKSSKDSISNPDKDVKTKISTKDSTGRELSEGQQKYFKDSTVRDENGNLLVMYRGDSNEFTVFDRKKTKHSNLYGRGFYFTNSKAHAEQYGDAREFYLDIKNPLSPKQNAITKKQMLNFLKAIENDGEDYDLYNYGQDATAESVLNSVWGKGDFEMLQDVNASAMGDLVAAVELFNEVNGTTYDGIILPTETVTFNSEQAKLTSNLNPTEDEDMRYSEKDIENDLYEELFGVPSEVEEKLSNQIDTWLQGKMKSNEVFDLGRTPAVLKELGAMDLPIVMAQAVLSKINGVKHDVSLENIRNLPKNIADPLMIFKSASVLNAFVILTEMEDMSGRPIIAALHLNKEEKHIRVNRITSVYGKDGIKNFINSQTKLGNLKYIDKIKSQNWSQSRGLQLPKLADTNPDNNIILYKEDIVNKYYMQNSRELLSDKDESVYDIMGETERDFSYDELIAKDDLEGFVIDKTKQVKLAPDGSIDENWIVSEVKKKCKVLKTNSDVMTYYTSVPDIGRNVEITKKGIVHSFFKSVGRTKKVSQRDLINARVSLELPKILTNSIEVNRADRGGNLDVPYVHIMIGTVGLEDANGNIEYYAVRSVIEERVNQNPILAEAKILGKLYAINAKKIGTPNAQVTKNGVALTYDVAYKYNVAQFLEDVKMEFDDTFSNDVYQRLGMTRNENEFSENLLFSDKDESVYDIMGETERIINDERNLDNDVSRLNEIVSKEEIPSRKFISLANYLKKLSESNIDTVSLGKKLKEAYISIQTSQKSNWRDISAMTYNIAESIMSSDLNVPVDYFKNVMYEIRKNKISLSKEQRASVEKLFGDYGKFHRYVFGRTNITKDGTPLSDMWKIWSKKYPSLFDANLEEVEQIENLVELITTLKTTSTILSEYEYTEAVRHLSIEIYNQFWNIAVDYSSVDKAQTHRKEHKALMSNLREEYKKRQADLAVHPVGETALKYEKLLKKVKDSQRKKVAIAKQHGKDMMSEYKERAERKTRIQSITANALTLNKWLTKNSKDYYIHDAMKGPVIKLLQALDFSSKTKLETGLMTQKDVSFAEAFSEVKSMLQNATNMVAGFEEFYGHDLTETIELLTDAAFNLIGDNSYVINAMSNTELYHLDRLIKHIKKTVTDINKFHIIEHDKGAVNLAKEFMVYGKKIGSLEKQHGLPSKILKFRNRTPYYFFKDLGEAGIKIFKSFQDGWDKLAFNSKKIIDFAKETYTEKEVKEWSNITKEFKIVQHDGNERTINMSIAQIMSLYCVAKQEDAQYHLLNGGMTLKRIDKKGHVVTDYDNITLSVSDIHAILLSLTDRQKEVADALQKFLNTVCSEWGNEISRARFGIEMFNMPNYFPIKVSEANTPTDNAKDTDNVSLFRLLNMAFTKLRKKDAPQSIEIGDVFDIFAQHSSDMAKYNALALPVLDFNKIYSIHYKDSNNNEYGFVQTLKSVFGDEADGYLRRFVRDLNGSQNVSRDVVGNKFFKNAKVAAVAANLRVILLQPTAFYKACAVMDNKYLIKAGVYIKVDPISMIRRLKKAIADAEKHCGIIQWKSLGYYDTDISKGITEKIKHADTWKDKVIEKSLKGAEIADKVTFGTLWVACEFEIRDTRKDLKVGSEEFYKAIAERLRDVIYATQVVDSTMTRSDMMRSPDKLDKLYVTFGSEPTIAYNMLLDLVTQYNRDKKVLTKELGEEKGKKEAKKRNSKKIRKVVTAYVITNAVAALVESGFDILRDDDDEEKDVAKYMKLYLKNFALDMSIGNKLPYIKEAYSILQGYSSSRMDTQWIVYTYNTASNFKKILDGEGDWEKAIKNLIKAASDLSGLPGYNIFRDAMAILDKLDLFD